MYNTAQPGCRRRGEAYLIAALALVCIVLFVPGAFFRDLWSPSEPRYAEVAREMVESGQWIVPHLNYEMYSDKPPLFFWLIALSAKVFGGFTAFAVVLPSCLAGIGTVLLTYMLGKKMFRSSLVGFLGGVILATSAEFLAQSNSAKMDTLLTCFETVSVFSFWQWHIEQTRSYLVPFYIGMALAVLTKGPVGLLPLLVALVYLAISRQGARVRQMHLALGLLGIAAITAAWLVPAAVIGGESYWRDILGRQIFGRVVKSWSHQRRFYYYMVPFTWGFLPWFALLPAAIIRYARERTERTALPTKFVVTWFLTIFIFFTAISGKRVPYILPLYPACALFLAKYLADIVAIGDRKPVELKVCFAVLFVALIGSGIMFGIIPFISQYKVAIPPMNKLGTVLTPLNIAGRKWIFYMASAYLAVTGISGLLSLRARTLKPAIIVVSCFMVCLVALANPIIIPFANQYTSAKPLGNTIKEVRKETERVGMYATYDADFTYYTESRIEKIENGQDLVAFLEQPGGAFCIIRSNDLERVKVPLPQGTVSLGTFKLGRKTLILLYNPPDSSRSSKSGTELP